MNSLNSILIEGNLTKDPLIRTTQRGTTLCTFSIASNRYFKQGNETEKEVSFFDVQAWGKLAESAGNLGRRGRGARVVGRLKQERWQNAEGQTQSKVVVVAEHIEFRPEFGKPANTETETETEETESVESPETEEVLIPTF